MMSAGVVEWIDGSMGRVAACDTPGGCADAPARAGIAGSRGLGPPDPNTTGGSRSFACAGTRGSAARLRGGMSDAWNHDFPRAEQNLMAILKELTLIDARTDGSLILTLDDPRLFQYPIVYMWEPGFWTMTDHEAERFREYLLKGGFAIFDDFEGRQWINFESADAPRAPRGALGQAR